MPSPAAPYRYKPALIFEQFDESRPWHVLVTTPGAERLVAERAYPLGFDVYFPQAIELLKKTFSEIERPVWGRYVLASSRHGANIARMLAVMGVVEVLGDEKGKPYALAGADVISWWRRQEAGNLDDGVRLGRRLFPRWVRVGHLARIVGGMTTFFAKEVEGRIVKIDSLQAIYIEATIMGRQTTICAPLVFLEKAV